MRLYKNSRIGFYTQILFVNIITIFIPTSVIDAETSSAPGLTGGMTVTTIIMNVFQYLYFRFSEYGLNNQYYVYFLLIIHFEMIILLYTKYRTF